jgi:hypothetical protein
MKFVFFRKGIKKRCYWCLEEDKKKLTKDHLPPRNIFPKEERKGLDLITVSILWKHLKSGSINIDERLEKCLSRGSLVKDKLITEVRSLPVELSNGQIIQYPILTDGREIIRGVLDSTARGFYYLWNGEIIPKDVVPEFEFKPTNYFNFQENPLHFQNAAVVKKNIFEFKLLLAAGEKSKFLCFEFKFYNLEPLPIYYYYEI